MGFNLLLGLVCSASGKSDRLKPVLQATTVNHRRGWRRDRSCGIFP
jgi:hypothetical protein